ncbi:MAG: TrkH family potassium uptake protein [Sphaerochaetaceae bacterium]|nr:TrkH family potassium uptake protein [Sphaerochaetaceae bacterium]
MLFIGLLMLIPTSMAYYYQEYKALTGFIIAEAMIVICSIIALKKTGKKQELVIKARDSYLFVTLTWVLATFFGAIPLFYTKSCPTFCQCYFEIMSGFTTTGATTFTVIEDKARSILFWRSMTNWLGGMGIVVLFVAVLPLLGVKGTGLVGAESVGPTKDKLTPKIRYTAIALWSIYLAISAIEVGFLILGDLSLYEATTVAFATMGAAGFCIKNSSIGGFESLYVDIVVTIFMFLAGMNFALFFKILQRKFKKVVRDGEFRMYFIVVITFTLLCTINLTLSGVYPNFLTSLRYAVFQVVSVVTTTGFATQDYCLWPTFSQMLLLVLFFIGGCAGSAGGGIKVIRIRTLFTLGKNTLIRRLHPRAVVPARIGDDFIAQDTILGIAGFVGLYVATGLIGAVFFALSGKDMTTCFAASFLCLGNIGIGFGEVGPTGNFSIFSDLILNVGSFLMLVGRLELFTVYALFTRHFWRG